MARITSSARRKHRLRAPASARPTLSARRNTGSEEDLSFVLKGKIPGISGELNVETRGTDRSPAAKATTMLILVAGACLAAITITVICKLVAAPTLLSAIAALAAFASVLITSTIISFRRDAAARLVELAALPTSAAGGRPECWRCRLRLRPGRSGPSRPQATPRRRPPRRGWACRLAGRRLRRR